MIFRPLAIVVMTLVTSAGSALAAEPDFSRFMASPSGAAGLSAAIGSLGPCATTPQWSLGFDPDLDKENPNHVYVGCQYDPGGDEAGELYDKGVLAKFVDYGGVLYLESLTQLP